MNTPQPDGLLLLGILIVGFYVIRAGGDNTPRPPIDEPSMQIKQAVEGVRALSSGSPDAARKIGPFYAAAVRIAQRDDVHTTQQMLNALEMAIKIKGDLNPDMGLPGLSEERNKIIKTLVGDENATLDPGKRKALGEVFKGIAWALEVPR